MIIEECYYKILKATSLYHKLNMNHAVREWFETNHQLLVSEANPRTTVGLEMWKMLLKFLPTTRLINMYA